MINDGVAFGFFNWNMHVQILRNRLKDSLITSLIGIYNLNNFKLSEDDKDLSTITEKERKLGKQYIIQIICGTTNHEAAVELRNALESARQPPYNKEDLIYSRVYYKKGRDYIQIK